MATNFTSNATYTGLGTFSIGVPNADQYQISGTLRLPGIPKGDATASSVVVVVKQNRRLKIIVVINQASGLTVVTIERKNIGKRT